MEPQAFEGLDWREEAECLYQPASLFFGFDDAESPSERRAREESAKLICSTCKVRVSCLDHALAANESYGIWGGLTEVELKARRRALRPKTTVSL